MLKESGKYIVGLVLIVGFLGWQFKAVQPAPRQCAKLVAARVFTNLTLNRRELMFQARGAFDAMTVSGGGISVQVSAITARYGSGFLVPLPAPMSDPFSVQLDTCPSVRISGVEW